MNDLHLIYVVPDLIKLTKQVTIREQLNLFGLLSYMDNNKITFTSDRGANILKALKSPSPSKHGEANTVLSDLPPKSEEVLKTITTSKKLVKYVKLAGLNENIEERGGVALKQECVIRWLSMSKMLESVDASIEHIRFILSSKSSKSQRYFKLNNINIDALKDLIGLLSEFKNVSSLVQTGTRPSLHMAYICINKLERHLSGTDVNADGENIDIYDRHEGRIDLNKANQLFYVSFLFQVLIFFRKRLIQLLKCMFTFDDKHLAAAILDPLYRKLTFASTYSKSIAYLYIREQLNDILGLSEQHKSMEDQFTDPDDNSGTDDIGPTAMITFKNDELERYLRMNIEDIYKQSNPLKFWHDHQNKFPGLSLLARRLFYIPVTSAGVERQFSLARLTITQCRPSLAPDTVNDVLFVRSIQNALDSKPDFFL
ncbi:unnamed protein product [Rotaria magnacalcarata]|uniref:HAT C-terminal dimerisation domain-containing protein n=2 Tax=Rotaria magnacalcarata TaxID=392030 RepID=A0A8S2P007_9BILA|nr:unnamed protein product [Rotaria magnacalcarata]